MSQKPEAQKCEPFRTQILWLAPMADEIRQTQWLNNIQINRFSEFCTVVKKLINNELSITKTEVQEVIGGRVSRPLAMTSATQLITVTGALWLRYALLFCYADLEKNSKC